MRKRTKRILFASAVAGAGSLAFVNSSAGKNIVSRIKQQISSSQKQPVLKTFIPPKSRSVSLDTNDDGAGVIPLKNRNAYLQTDAATKIQSIGRGYLARKRLKAENEAATKIQSLRRGYLARKRVKEERKLRRLIQENVAPAESMSRPPQRKWKVKETSRVTLTVR